MSEFFVFRINQLKIKDIHEWGSAEIKLFSFVTSGDTPIPILDDLLHTTDLNQKKAIIKQASAEVLSAKEFVEIQNIEDEQQLTFGPEGYALYTADKIPVSFNWFFMGTETDRSTNELGRQLEGILDTPDFDNFTGNVITAIAATATPQITAAIAIAKFLSKTVFDFMKNNVDDQLGVYYISFNRFQHYPHGEYKRDDIPDLSNNLLVDYSIFGTTY